MADYYISPTGSGSQNGIGIGNASTLSQLDSILAKAQAGDRVLIIADKGDYNVSKAITLTHGGTDAGNITIKGVSSSGADMKATFVSNRAETYSPTAVQGQEVFKLLDGASHLSFENMAFQDINTAFRFGGKLSDISLQHMTADNLNRFAYNLVSGTATDATVSGLTIKDVDVTGFAKAVVSLRYDTNNVVIEDVTGDSQHIDGSNFATGVQLDGTVHDVLVKDTKMGNITDTVNAYWNGDGFAAEGGVYNLAFVNTYAYNNTDAGYDLKSKSTTLTNAVAEGNTRNFRFWASDTVLDGVKGIDPTYHGGVSTSPSNVWLATNAKVTIKNSEFTDKGGKAFLFDLKNNGATLNIDNIVTNQTDLADIAKSATAKLIGLINDAKPTEPTPVEATPPVVVKPVPPVVGDVVVTPPPPPPPAASTAINGTDSNNTLNGTAGNDLINGKDGKDVLNGGLGNDSLDGGRNEDQLGGGDGDDLLSGGVNADTIQGGAGKDVVYGDVAVMTAATAGGNDNVYGGDGDDVIFGDGVTMTGAQGGKDYLYGGVGNDIIYGDAKSLTAGSKGAADILYGDDGNDTLYGDGATSDASSGGDDKLYGGKGNDVLYGGGGSDTFYVEGKGFGNDVIADFSRSAGNQDKIDLSQMKVAFADLNIKVVGKDTVITFASGDSITVKNFTGLTKDHIIAASKSDKAALGTTEAPKPVVVAPPVVEAPKTGNVTLNGTNASETIRAGDGSDKIYGLKGNDKLYGGAGDDVIYGRQDDDTLFGEDGSDKLMGDGGRDVLNGGRGNDFLSGGDDADIFIFAIGGGNDQISDFDSDDFIDFSGTSLKASDVQIVDTSDGVLLRYGTDSILLKDAEHINSDQFIFA